MSDRGNPFENERASLLKLNTRKYSKLISDEMIHENNLLIRTDQINLISGQWNQKTEDLEELITSQKEREKTQLNY